jgi:hypothetical protein
MSAERRRTTPAFDDANAVRQAVRRAVSASVVRLARRSPRSAATTLAKFSHQAAELTIRSRHITRVNSSLTINRKQSLTEKSKCSLMIATKLLI